MSQAHVLADPRAPVPTADDSEEDVADTLRAIELGRESALTEPLIDDDAVFAMARDRALRP